MNVFDQKLTPIVFPDVLVEEAGTLGTNGRYKFAGYYGGKPYWLQTYVGNLSTGELSRATTPYEIFVNGTWTLGIRGVSSEYNTLDGLGMPWEGTWFTDGGTDPAPGVGFAGTLLSHGVLTVKNQWKTLAELGPSIDQLGGANAIMLSAMPNAMAQQSGTDPAFGYGFGETPQPYFWDPLDFAVSSFYHGPISFGENPYTPPLLITGQKSITSLRLGWFTETQVFYQLFTGAQ